MKNIAFLFGIFAMMSCNFAIGSSCDVEGKEWGEFPRVSKASPDRDEIVRDCEVTVQNPVFGIKSPGQKRATLSKAESSRSPYGNRGLDPEERTPLPVPLLQLEPKKLSFEGLAARTRKNLHERKKLHSYRHGEYEDFGQTSPRKSLAEQLREREEAEARALELKTIEPDPKNPRFRELFWDNDASHGLNIGAINERRKLVREGGGVEGGGDDFSNSLALVQTFLGTIAREEEEIKKLKSLLEQAKKQDVPTLREQLADDIEKERQSLMAYQAKIVALSRSDEKTTTEAESAQVSLAETKREVIEITKRIEAFQNVLQDIRDPEDIALELARTGRRLSQFKIERGNSLRKLGKATGVSLSKLKKLPPIFPERRSPANAHWDK